MVGREEYVEQVHFFRTLGERIRENLPMQEVLASVREEILSTTKLPLAIDYMLSELQHQGVFASAMARLEHYFTPFQTYLVTEAEDDRGGFDMRLAMDVMRLEATYRAEGGSPQGVVLYQFETLCRNRLSYDRGLAAMAADPIFDEDWREWILTVRRQVGIVDFGDMVYVRSQHYLDRKSRLGESSPVPEKPVLFGAKEGKIALANHGKDPLYLFSALQRQLGYPVVPRPQPADETPQTLLPVILQRLGRIETRIKLVEDERKEGIDITRFYQRPEQNKSE